MGPLLKSVQEGRQAMTPVDSLLNLFESHKRQSAGALPIQAVIVSNDRMAASIRARSLGIERWSLIEPDVYIALLK